MASSDEHLYAIRTELDEPLDTDADITEIEAVIFSTLAPTKRVAIERNAWYIRREFDRNPVNTSIHVVRQRKLQRSIPSRIVPRPPRLDERVVPVTRRRPQQHRLP